jgi:predicted enzyme involved in methoxymalonyl-ACP biosynthesis
VEIPELLLSCRALGRGLEDFILKHAFAEILTKFESKTLFLVSKDGPRNAPAIDWIQRNLTRFHNGIDEGNQFWSYTQKDKS